MRYRLTPLNIICAMLVVYDIYLFITPQSVDAEIARAYLIPIILLGIISDFILQKIIKRKSWLFAIEIVLVILLIVINELP